MLVIEKIFANSFFNLFAKCSKKNSCLVGDMGYQGPKSFKSLGSAWAILMADNSREGRESVLNLVLHVQNIWWNCSYLLSSGF